MSLVRIPYTISLSVDGSDISAHSISYNHAFNSTFATITVDVGGSYNFIFPRGVNDPLHPVSYSVIETITNKEVLSGDGIVTAINLGENNSGSSCSVTIMPSAYLMDSVNSVFNGINANGSLLQDFQDAQTLIAAIIAQHNLETGQSVSHSMDSGTFTTTVIPRFFGMSYIEMINRIVSSRGLLIRVGFDNIIHVVSFSQAPSSDLVITVNSTDNISYNSNELVS